MAQTEVARLIECDNVAYKPVTNAITTADIDRNCKIVATL